MLRAIVSEAALNFGQADAMKVLLSEAAINLREKLWGDIERDFGTLSPLMQVVLITLIEQSTHFAPFAERALTRYAEKLGQKSVSASAVQSALDTLREKGWIWRESRAGYVLEDSAVAQWYYQMQPDRRK